jgi:hypothetical protein
LRQVEQALRVGTQRAVVVTDEPFSQLDRQADLGCDARASTVTLKIRETPFCVVRSRLLAFHRVACTLDFRLACIL